MTDKELKELKDTLWHSADVLRASAHLAANKYGQPYSWAYLSQICRYLIQTT